MSALDVVRAAENAMREIRAVAAELRRVEREGLPYTGPEIEWQSGNLGATRPEPHIALDREYLDSNDLDVDREYMLSLHFAVTQEYGHRECALSQSVTSLTQERSGVL